MCYIIMYRSRIKTNISTLGTIKTALKIDATLWRLAIVVVIMFMIHLLLPVMRKYSLQILKHSPWNF